MQKLKRAKADWIHTRGVGEFMDDYDSYVRSTGGNTATYVTEWTKRCEERPITLQVSFQPDIFDQVNERLPQLDKFGLAIARHGAPISLRGKFIDLLRVAGNGQIVLEDCAIRSLELGDSTRDVTLRNCKIGVLRLASGSVGTFEVIGGRIERIFAPIPSDRSPFIGSVEVRNVQLSSNFENAQAYRNLRHHLTVLHNHEAASIFHAAEMEAEVGKQSLIDKIISVFYRLISNYGGSSARPLAIFLAAVTLNFAFLIWVDGVTPLGDPNEADGWHYYLYGFDQRSQVMRAAVFSVSQVFNPLGIFGTRLLLAAKTPLVALVSASLGLASTIAFALFALAVRRRFRLDRST